MPRPDYDVIVGGGSVAGLAFAGEACRLGLSVLVAEEHETIGEPEKCDGLVSLRGLRKHGFLPDDDVVQSHVEVGIVHSPGGGHLELSARTLEVVVLDRSMYDRQLAKRAIDSGAKLVTGARAVCKGSESLVQVELAGRSHTAHYYLDATGPSSSPKRGIIPAAKYELEADWVREGVVEVFADAEKYPGFFAWVIPFGGKKAKVGAAGRGINSFAALEKFLSGRPYRLIRRVAAPIYVGGPVESFHNGGRILVGESAGMVKPTTAGGIVTSIAGAALAAKWLSRSIEQGDPGLLSNYEREWDRQYGSEMRAMTRLRSVFEKLSNSDIDSLTRTLSKPSIISRLSESDFDFHASAVLSALGAGGLISVAKVVASAEARSLLAQLQS